MIQQIRLADGLTVRLRTSFQLWTTKDGEVILDTRTGLRQFRASGLVAGSVDYGVDDARPADVRVRVLGTDPGFHQGDVIVLSDSVMNSWFHKQRGSKPKSGVTITAGRAVLAPAGVHPKVRGGLPGAIPDEIAITMLGHTRESNVADVCFPPVNPWEVEGVAEVFCSAVADELIGQLVRPIGLQVFFKEVDDGDANARNKAKLVLSCTSFERFVPPTIGNGHTPKPPKTAPVPSPSGELVGAD